MKLDTCRVRDLMQRRVVTVAPSTTVGQLMRVLSRNRIGGVPVVDEDGTVRGVVSTTDIMALADREVEAPRPVPAPEEEEHGGKAVGEAPSGFFGAHEGVLWHLPLPLSATRLPERFELKPVREIMMPASFRVRGDATAVELARFLTRAGIHRALVMDGPILRGIVTATDVVRLVAEDPVAD